MVLGLVNQLPIFWQLCLIELLGLLTGLGLLELVISKAFDRVWHACLLHKLRYYGISGGIFDLISSFLSNRQLQVVQDGKSSQKYPVNAGVLQGSIFFVLHFSFYVYLLDDVICNIAVHADGTALYSKCDQASDLWQQLELAAELESDLQDTGLG